MNDLIERQAAIDALRVAYWDDKIQSAKDDPCIVDAMTDWAIRQVKALPSVQPEPKTAHWVPLDERFASWSSYYKCSECGFRINLRTVMDFGGRSVNYCPNCGAKMEVKK